ncbi:MAG: peptidylprolyl isomerase [Desulfobulbaceae bacterium]|nr:peptidylprolyl isomerase [Desulfobulbaceae bacterium]
MQPAQTGDQITLIYDGILANGEIFESSTDTGPLDFVIGDGSVLPAFEAAVLGMKPGEIKTIKVPPQGAYGTRDEELVQTVSRSNINTQAELAPGVVVGMALERDGQSVQVPAMVTVVADDQITVDFNHPLAGQELFYRITVQSISHPQTDGACSCSPDSGSDCGHC